MIWCQSGFVVWNVARSIFYYQAHTPASKNKFRDTLVLNHAQYESLAWIKKHEVRYGSRMFDIKRQYRQDDNYVLVGHYDDKETKLFAGLDKMMGAQDDSPAQKQQHFIWKFDAVVINQNYFRFIPVLNSDHPSIFRQAYYPTGICTSVFQPPDAFVA